MHIFKKSRAFENVIVDIRFESMRVKYKYMQSLPGHRPWLLTAINRVSGQGRCIGRQLGLGFVLAFRVEKQNIGSSRNRNPVGAVYSN